MNRKLCQSETEAREFASQKHYPGWEQIAMIFKMGSGKFYVQIVEGSSGCKLELVDVYHNGKVLSRGEAVVGTGAGDGVGCKCGAD